MEGVYQNGFRGGCVEGHIFVVASGHPPPWGASLSITRARAHARGVGGAFDLEPATWIRRKPRRGRGLRAPHACLDMYVCPATARLRAARGRGRGRPPRGEDA